MNNSHDRQIYCSLFFMNFQVKCLLALGIQMKHKNIQFLSLYDWFYVERGNNFCRNNEPPTPNEILSFVTPVE